MQYVDYFGYGLHQLVYVSRMTRPMDADEIDRIVERSSKANDARSISGALLVCGDLFIQALEGDHAGVKALFERIEADPRHNGVSIRGVEPLDRRVFGRWGMRRGQAAGDGGLDLSTLRGADLVAMLRLSTRRLGEGAAAGPSLRLRSPRPSATGVA